MIPQEDEIPARIQDALTRCQKNHFLNLKNLDLTESEFEKWIFPFLKKNTKKVQRLNLSGNRLGDHGARMLVTALTESEQPLTHLKLKDTHLGPNGVRAIATLLKPNTKLAPSLGNTLMALDLSGNNNHIGPEGISAITTALEKNTVLWYLDGIKWNTNATIKEVMNHNLREYSLKKAFEQFEETGNLNLENLGLSMEDLQTVFERMSISTWSKWTTVNMAGNHFGDEGIKMIATALKENASVISLNLENNDITDEGAQAISELLEHTVLSALKLNNNEIGIKGADLIRNSLLKNNSVLSLDANFLDPENDTLPYNSVLSFGDDFLEAEEVNSMRFKIPNIRQETYQALRQNQSMHAKNIENKINESIKTGVLNLKNMRLTALELEKIFKEALKKNITLISIVLDNKLFIESKRLDEIHETLHANRESFLENTLEEALKMGFLHLDHLDPLYLTIEEFQNWIIPFLKKNQNIRSLQLGKNFIPYDQIQAMQEVVRSHERNFYFENIFEEARKSGSLHLDKLNNITKKECQDRIIPFLQENRNIHALKWGNNPMEESAIKIMEEIVHTNKEMYRKKMLEKIRTTGFLNLDSNITKEVFKECIIPFLQQNKNIIHSIKLEDNYCYLNNDEFIDFTASLTETTTLTSFELGFSRIDEEKARSLLTILKNNKELIPTTGTEYDFHIDNPELFDFLQKRRFGKELHRASETGILNFRGWKLSRAEFDKIISFLKDKGEYLTKVNLGSLGDDFKHISLSYNLDSDGHRNDIRSEEWNWETLNDAASKLAMALDKNSILTTIGNQELNGGALQRLFNVNQNLAYFKERIEHERWNMNHYQTKEFSIPDHNILNDLNAKEYAKYEKTIISFLKNERNIQEVNLGPWVLSVPLIGDILEQNKSLTSLKSNRKDLIDALLAEPRVRKLLIHNRLTEAYNTGNLNLKEIPLNSKEFEEWIMPFLQENINKLRKLRLEGSALGDNGASLLANVLRNGTQLTTLDITNSHVGPNGLKSILMALEDKIYLTEFYMEDNPIGDAGAYIIADFLSRNNTLKTFRLLQSTDISSEGMKAIAQALKKNINLSSLSSTSMTDHMKRLKMPQLQKTQKLLGRNLRRNIVSERLTDASIYGTLDLGGHPKLTPQEFKMLCIPFLQNPKHLITKLDCGDSDIGDEEAILLAKNLKSNKGIMKNVAKFLKLHKQTSHMASTLLFLNIKYTKIGPKGLVAIANSLKTNKTLRTLIVPDFALDDPITSSAILEALSVNKTLCKLYCSGANNDRLNQLLNRNIALLEHNIKMSYRPLVAELFAAENEKLENKLPLTQELAQMVAHMAGFSTEESNILWQKHLGQETKKRALTSQVNPADIIIAELKSQMQAVLEAQSQAKDLKAVFQDVVTQIKKIIKTITEQAETNRYSLDDKDRGKWAIDEKDAAKIRAEIAEFRNTLNKVSGTAEDIDDLQKACEEMINNLKPTPSEILTSDFVTMHVKQFSQKSKPDLSHIESSLSPASKKMLTFINELTLQMKNNQALSVSGILNHINETMASIGQYSTEKGNVFQEDDAKIIGSAIMEFGNAFQNYPEIERIVYRLKETKDSIMVPVSPPDKPRM